jgi:RsiW-degrading membrane proteinase PrsW (M82 family)
MSLARPMPLRLAAHLAALAVCAVPATWFVRLLADVPALIVVTAAVPALLWAWCLTRIDVADREPPAALAAALLAGSVVAGWLAHTANARVLAWAAHATSTDAARALVGGFGAPAIEEVAKAAVLLPLVVGGWNRRRGPVDGIVYGGLVGVGFAFTENVVYLTFAMLQGGPAGLLRGLYLRALLGGWNHAAFTATTGAALGYAVAARGAAVRSLVAAIGLGLAIVQHVAWNAVAASAISGVLCGPELGTAPCRAAPSWTSLLVLVPILMVVFVGPGFVTLWAVAAMARRSARPAPPTPQN